MSATPHAMYGRHRDAELGRRHMEAFDRYLRSMTSVSVLGAIIMPPVPAFYARPQSVDDISSTQLEAVWGEALQLGTP